jgi:NADH-quinone oxidoreductase subunit L
MSQQLILFILIFAPLVGFVINGFRYKQHSAELAGGIASGAAVISFICSVLLAVELIAMPSESRKISLTIFDWISVADLKINAAFVVDQISAVMVLIITGVGSLIHLFSISYMHHDKGVAKYFSYLNFFLFNMLLLVLGENLLVMFVGWEGVGLCSYLLIGFWFTDKEKATAGMKAFITNRIGDAAFLLGMFVLFINFGTLSFSEIIQKVPTVAEIGWLGPVTLATMFLFIGATGKSAQIPLYVWLPDAMAGPTPVSALIHAATMVTAGVYMIVRLSPVFIIAPNTMMVIAIVGAATAVFAATIGMVQNDIKKVLAYSTVSQLGYMFLACGVGAFGAAMAHLMTHAFFKALMFLGSGSVIHAMSEEQDIRKMGGLKKHMPITHATFLLGWLAIIGIPPFAGFFSKDEILWMSFHSPMGHWGLWLAGVIGAVLTAFYMTRLMALTFWGKSRVDKKIHPHESPALMTVPLIILGILSVIGGWVAIPHVLGQHLGHIPNLLENWYEPIVAKIPNLAHAEEIMEWGLMGVSVVAAALSAIAAFVLYIRSPDLPVRLADKFSRTHKVILNKYYVDELYFGSIINPLVNVSKSIWYYVDVNLIDKTTYVVADLVRGGGSFVRAMQNGNIQQYGMYIALGLVISLTFILAR